MIFVKLILPILAYFAIITGLKLQYEWSDRRTKKFKIGIFVLYSVSIISLFLTLFVTYNDHKNAVENNNIYLKNQERLEFLQHRTDEVNNIKLLILLNDSYNSEKHGQFHVLLEVLNPPDGTIYLSSFGPATFSNFFIAGRPAPPGVQHTSWSVNEHLKFDEMLQDTMIGGLPRERITTYTSNGGPLKSVEDFDGSVLRIYLTESIWGNLESIALVINDYLIMNQPRSCLAIADSVHSGNVSSNVDWPLHRQPSNDLKWVKVVPKYYKPDGKIPPLLAFILNYSYYTPIKLTSMTDEHFKLTSIPTCDWYGDTKP